MIPVEAVEAARKVAFERYGTKPDAAYLRTILEAAAPHMLRGDGDYRPGWDDRKTLSSLWQEHAPLPDEGLSERVYEALIAVATWGYQQRKDEEL